MNTVMFSSEKCEWGTPQYLFDALDQEFGFDLDVCALPDNAKCALYYTPDMDGLKQEWAGSVWMNPPYGRTIGKWMAKAYNSSLNGATVVTLIPARTETRWWHDYCVKASEIRYIKGRVKFGGSKINAPFPNAIVVFRPVAINISADDMRLIDELRRGASVKGLHGVTLDKAKKLSRFRNLIDSVPVIKQNKLYQLGVEKSLVLATLRKKNYQLFKELLDKVTPKHTRSQIKSFVLKER